MKILIISGAFPPNASGEAANTFHLADRLAQAGVEVHLLTTAQPGVTALPGVSLYPLMKRWSWLEMWRLATCIRDCKPDGILLMFLGGIYNYHPMMSYAATLAKWIAPNVRFVTRFENPLSPVKYHSFIDRAVRKVMSLLVGASRNPYGVGTLLCDSDGVIVLSEYHLALLLESDPKVVSKAVIIPPPPNVQVIPDSQGQHREVGRRRLGVAPDEFVVGYLGYVYRNKGMETLLEALARLRERTRRGHLVVIGGACDIPGLEAGGGRYYEDMQRLAAQLKMDRHVSWTGAFSTVTGEVAEHIHAADVFVLPFDKGIHLNNSSFASLATYGKPIIATTCGNSDRALLDGRSVRLCPPQDAEAITQALEDLLSAPERRYQLGQGAAQLAARWLSWSEAIDRTVRLLEGADHRSLRTS